jgi:hypothetical protein
MLVALDIAAALAIAYAGLVMAIYTDRVRLCAALVAALIGVLVYLSF